jgi:hypothetical protein
MANMRFAGGTLFMALEEGASWPHFLRRLRRSAANVQAVVQTPGEPAEQFAKRALARWRLVLDGSAPPHRFVLGTNECWDAQSTDVRKCLAKSAFATLKSEGASELILWGGGSDSHQYQGRLLALAGALVEGEGNPKRMVRVLFKAPDPLIELSAASNSAQPKMLVA